MKIERARLENDGFNSDEQLFIGGTGVAIVFQAGVNEEDIPRIERWVELSSVVNGLLW